VAARFLDDEARAAFKRAVEAIETASAVEVVIAVRRASARYLHANAIVAVAVAVAALAFTLYAEHAFPLAAILVDPFALGALAGALVQILPAVKRALTPAAERDRVVRRAARATFVERGVHATTGRSGLLVYISGLEREVALVADLGLARALGDDTLGDAERVLSAAVAVGGVEVARRLEALAPRMAKALAHGADDVNELPDAIDEGGA
jgi:putative membrane protein